MCRYEGKGLGSTPRSTNIKYSEKKFFAIFCTTFYPLTLFSSKYIKALFLTGIVFFKYTDQIIDTLPYPK